VDEPNTDDATGLGRSAPVGIAFESLGSLAVTTGPYDLNAIHKTDGMGAGTGNLPY